MINFCQIFDHPIYIVGGCVRDQLLGLKVKDIDIASDLRPEEFKKLCQARNIKTIDTGIDHGTITALIDKVPYEHTTFREDVSNDGRNATIRYSKTIEEDLSRRDFTINAIAMLEDKVIDPFNGREDLKNRLLRTVGHPDERFQEDYLRIIRAARFQSRLNLTPAPGLIEATQKLSHKIMEHVSIERITDEFEKAQLHGKEFITCAREMGFLKHVLPESQQLNHYEEDQWLKQIENSQSLNKLQFFAALLIPLKSKCLSTLTKKFKLSNQIAKGLLLFQNHTGELAHSKLTATELRRLKLSLKNYFSEFCIRIDQVCETIPAERENLISFKDLQASVDLSITSPFINGNTLQNLGLKPGPHFKSIIDEAGELQAEGKSREEVLAKVEDFIKRHKK